MKKVLIAGVFSLLATPSFAFDKVDNIFISASTLGLGLGFKTEVNLQTILVMQINVGEYTIPLSIGDGYYKVENKLLNYAALLQYQPEDTSFYWTGGVYLNLSKYKSNLNTQKSEEGAVFLGDAKTTFSTVSPYVGIGWTQLIKEKFVVGLETGLMYQNAKTSFEVDCSINACSDEAKKQQKDFTSFENKFFSFYPNIKFSIGF